MENKLDEDLYSRQILTYGLDTMNEIRDLKILIIGLRGLGVEIAKNLILAGPNEVCISDKNKCKINDLGSNFYINEEDINNKTLEDSCYDKLNSLNPYVTVTKHEGLYKGDLKKFNVIIITEIMNLEDLYEINKICRKNNINFIYTLNLGLTGFLFNDFGPGHIVKDSNGEKKLKYNIVSIEDIGNSYEIFLDIQEKENFGLRENDEVIFKNVKGLEFLNNGKPKKIIKCTNSSFEIEKTDKSDDKYISDGIVEEVKNCKEIEFKEFKDNFIKLNNNYISIDTRKKNSNVLLHCAFVGLHLYYNKYNRLPELNNLKQVEEIVELSKNYYKAIKKDYVEFLKIKKKKIIEFDENYILNVLRWSKAEINPICAFLGGIVSQEALKITRKYTPIYQWLRFDFFETIEYLPNNINRNPLNCRYDDQIAIFGQEIQEKLKNLNIFMVGAGALGCEFIKNFGLMGISCKNGEISITDNDKISLSNLNRQFLFNKIDVQDNSFKSSCVKREALKINKNMNIKDFQLLINETTRNIFNDEFIEKQNILVSAVDNIEARKFIDKLCTFYDKILIDSGTEGTKANSDIYIPHKSICLNDLTFEKKETIPQCTLRSFATNIEHCIELSKSIFTKLFDEDIKNLKLIIKDNDRFYHILNEKNNLDELYLAIEEYKNIFHIIENPSSYLIMKFALFLFKYYFIFDASRLLKELENSSSNNKRPTPLRLNLEDENVILNFKSFYYIISHLINFNQDFDIGIIQTVIESEEISIIESHLNKKKLIQNFKLEIENKIKTNENNIQEKINAINPIEFEKDNDENYHVKFLLSFSNLRANIFRIENTDFFEVKEIAGNIIPAIASTTAGITGLSCLQIYTLLQTDNLKSFRSSAFNLATSEFDLFIPEEKRIKTSSPKERAIPEEFSDWDKIVIHGPNKTVKDFIDFFKNKYSIVVEYINNNDHILASPIDGDEDYNKSIEQLIEEEYNKPLNKNMKYIKLEITGSIDDVNVNTPIIKYTLK
jgi:ubiquitin-activating enzyme E1